MFVQHTSVSSGPNWKLKCRVPRPHRLVSVGEVEQIQLLTEVNKVKDCLYDLQCYFATKVFDSFGIQAQIRNLLKSCIYFFLDQKMGGVGSETDHSEGRHCTSDQIRLRKLVLLDQHCLYRPLVLVPAAPIHQQSFPCSVSFQNPPLPLSTSCIAPILPQDLLWDWM